MKLFKRKPARRANSRPTISPHVERSANRATLMHRFTRDLVRAERLAQMLAQSRAAAVVDVPDFLAGMYIYEWDRLSRFWEEHEEIEALLQRLCEISPQRWHRWIEFYDALRNESQRKPGLFAALREDSEQKPGPLGALRKASGKKPGIFGNEPKNAAKETRLLPRSAELELVLRNSEAIAPHHDTVDGRMIPILTSECVLLCIAFNDGSDLGRRLRETGLDTHLLERAARNPRHAPLR